MENINIRQIVVQGIFVVIGLLLLIRLFFMQVMDTSYVAMARNNAVREISSYPSRGLIYDRNDTLLVNNEPVYDLMIIPNQIQPFDTLKLCNLLGVTIADFYENYDHLPTLKGYSPYKPQTLFKQIPAETYARVQEYLYQFPGFYPQIRTVRIYHTGVAGHILGYIGEANQQQIDTSSYYRMGDYVGISGIERYYEKALRGERGVKYMMIDVHGTEVGKFADSQYDREAIAGQNLQLTLDMELQAYCEQIMANKKGSIVAIEPTTGEILAMVSSPYYDPRLLTGPLRGKAMAELSQDPLKPLFNRALSAYYPPGSIFKPIMALIALQEGVSTPNTYFPCYGAYKLGLLRVKCHHHAQCYSVQTALEHSCNAYFCHLFKICVEQNKYDNLEAGLRDWKRYLSTFNLGIPMITDVPGPSRGYIPGPERYDRMYGKKYWKANSIISLGIGQGEMGMTPLQMAHSMAIIANRGKFYYPHVTKPLVGDKDNPYIVQHKVPIEERHFLPVIEGMRRVVTTGTARLKGVGGLDICGKTGTAQNPHGKDHSLFAAFAPMNNPKIAVAVIIENAGWGYKIAAPIASLVINKYLNRETGGSLRGLEYKMMRLTLMYRPRIDAPSLEKPKEKVEEVSDDDIRSQFFDGGIEDEARAIQNLALPNPSPYQQPAGPTLPGVSPTYTKPDPATTPPNPATPSTIDPPPAEETPPPQLE
ncbi:MAG: penicillin-binding protein 2 [Chitinophagales bacterium]|nr:penicillin-binding protein 2 [Chitinophagales bacterium]